VVQKQASRRKMKKCRFLMFNHKNIQNAISLKSNS